MDAWSQVELRLRTEGHDRSRVSAADICQDRFLTCMHAYIS